MGTAIKHPVPDRVKPSFVIFDIRALWRSGLSVRVPGCQKFGTYGNSGRQTHRWALEKISSENQLVTSQSVCLESICLRITVVHIKYRHLTMNNGINVVYKSNASEIIFML